MQERLAATLVKKPTTVHLGRAVLTIERGKGGSIKLTDPDSSSLCAATSNSIRRAALKLSKLRASMRFELLLPQPGREEKNYGFYRLPQQQTIREGLEEELAEALEATKQGV